MLYLHISASQSRSAYRGQKKASSSLEPCYSEPPCQFWEPNHGPLQEQQVVLTAGPPLQPHSNKIFIFDAYITYLTFNVFNVIIFSIVQKLKISRIDFEGRSLLH